MKSAKRLVRPDVPFSSPASAASHASIRESNLALVTSELFDAGGGLSRADLATRTGLARATVSRLVRDLIAMGMITEGSPEDSGSIGRPGTPLYPASHTTVGIGLEVNVDRLAGVAVDLAGQRVHSFEDPVDLVGAAPEIAFQALIPHLEEMLRALTEAGVREIVGVVLAVPGAVDEASNRVVYAPNLSWHNVYPEKYLGPAIRDLSFAVDNDANLQALAISTVTGGEEGHPASFLYLTGDVGIGGALMEDGVAARGHHGWAGEIGHVTIEPDGPPCHCGSKGCLERYAGRRAILEAAGLGDSGTTSELVAQLEAGNERAKAAVDRAAWALGIALSNAVNLLDVDKVVLGTSLVQLLPWLLPGIEAEMKMRVLDSGSRDIQILPAAAEELPAPMGGALLALRNTFSSLVGAAE